MALALVTFPDSAPQTNLSKMTSRENIILYNFGASKVSYARRCGVWPLRKVRWKVLTPRRQTGDLNFVIQSLRVDLVSFEVTKFSENWKWMDKNFPEKFWIILCLGDFQDDKWRPHWKHHVSWKCILIGLACFSATWWVKVVHSTVWTWSCRFWSAWMGRNLWI